MSNFKEWIKRFFSKDPAIRYAKQIKQGNIKLVALKDDRPITALRYIAPRIQLPLLVFSIFMLFIWSKAYVYLINYVATSDCQMWFGLAQPLISQLKFISMFFLTIVSCVPVFIWLYRVKVKTDWHLLTNQSYNGYAVYRRTKKFKRLLFKVICISYVILALIGLGLSLFSLFLDIQSYSNFADYNQAMIEECEINRIKESEDMVKDEN